MQRFPLGYNHNNPLERYREAGRLWGQTVEPGSGQWHAVIEELVARGVMLDPTFAIYEAQRDVMRARRLVWLDEYALPSQMEQWGNSYLADWTSSDEAIWQAYFNRVMRFVRDYKNAGGLVTTGGDEGANYALFGFGYVRELELLQEAGFTSLEAIRAGTFHSAKVVGMQDDIGSVEIGKKADLVIVNRNPLQDLKVFYGTYGLARKNEGAGIQYTIKNGMVWDAQKLLATIRHSVAWQKTQSQH